MLRTVAYSTDTMSWPYLLSAMRSVEAEHGRVDKISLNLSTPSAIVLCCLSLEAFVNEVSSLAHGFLFRQKQFEDRGYSPEPANASSLPLDLARIASIRRDKKGAFHSRYVGLCDALAIERPPFLSTLSILKKLRDALVHFRDCDVPVIDDGFRTIRSQQELPQALTDLLTVRHRNVPVVIGDSGANWTTRISNDAMAAWSLALTTKAILYVLQQLPTGAYRTYVYRAYESTDATFASVFARAESELEAWWAINHPT